jgi:hypothetical protein
MDPRSAPRGSGEPEEEATWTYHSRAWKWANWQRKGWKEKCRDSGSLAIIKKPLKYQRDAAMIGIYL